MSAIKRVVRGLASLAVLPARLSYEIRAPFVGRDRAFVYSCERFSRIPGCRASICGEHS